MWIRKVGIGAIRKALLILGLCAGVSLIAATARADTLINFDNVPDGTVINNEYSGVTFSCNVAGGGCQDGVNVYARSDADAASGGNVLSSIYTQNGSEIIPYQGDEYTGAILVQFATAQSAASIDADPVNLPEGVGPSGYAYLQAYDSNLNLLGQVEDPTLGQYTTLSLSSADDISYLLIGDVQASDHTISLFDNLCYSGDASGCSASGSDGGGGGTPTAPTPEPSSFILFGVGLTGLCLLRRFHFA